MSHKVVFIGDTNTGKTSLINFAADKHFTEDVAPSISSRTLAVEIKIDDFVSTLSLWDTPGQDMYQSMSKIYVREAEAVVIVFDLTNPDTFESVDSWKEFVQDVLPDTNYFIVGNKIDLSDQRKVENKDAINLAAELNACYFEVSALSGEGIGELINEIAKTIVTKPVMQSEKSILEQSERKKTTRQIEEERSKCGC